MNTIRLKKINNNWYCLIFLDVPVEKKNCDKVIGIDIDYTNGAVDSLGNVWIDDEWVELRKRTKWREYKRGVNPLRQKLNSLAKEYVNKYQCNFAFEKLEFKGKKGRSKRFRRNYKNIPYMHLAHRIETLAALEGFKTVKVSPMGTSQTCPVCGYRSKKNRNGDKFLCGKCSFEEHVDVVGAVNIALRASLRYKFQPLIIEAVPEGWRKTPSQSRAPADLRRCDPPCHNLSNRITLDRYG